ncbi:hypothetical protein FIBSPDRAFT_189954 [Athelia psychrophila]|uniref:Uncharacterized protein n=1 Tax=Athelia psychrophila TaxID=1759441 RepID=A0A166A556_9AGAM|nr:hypothetical protein FIBSPDRAFT_189954 [Fibularhizoctonia sp. CBS 109695]
MECVSSAIWGTVSQGALPLVLVGSVFLRWEGLHLACAISADRGRNRHRCGQRWQKMVLPAYWASLRFTVAPDAARWSGGRWKAGNLNTVKQVGHTLAFTKLDFREDDGAVFVHAWFEGC